MPLLHQNFHDQQPPVKPFDLWNSLVNVIFVNVIKLTLTQKLYLLGLRAGAQPS